MPPSPDGLLSLCTGTVPGPADRRPHPATTREAAGRAERDRPRTVPCLGHRVTALLPPRPQPPPGRPEPPEGRGRHHRPGRRPWTLGHGAGVGTAPAHTAEDPGEHPWDRGGRKGGTAGEADAECEVGREPRGGHASTLGIWERRRAWKVVRTVLMEVPWSRSARGSTTPANAPRNSPNNTAPASMPSACGDRDGHRRHCGRRALYDLSGRARGEVADIGVSRSLHGAHSGQSGAGHRPRDHHAMPREAPGGPKAPYVPLGANGDPPRLGTRWLD